MKRDLCIMACALCRDKLFQEWVIGGVRAGLLGHLLADSDEGLSKAFILDACDISSRKYLDTNPYAAKRFHELVRKPFLDWKEHQSTAPAGR